MPDHLARMCLFKINTGCREQEVCRLRWEWEIKVPELETSVFIIPGSGVKNGEDRLVVLNRVAKSVAEWRACAGCIPRMCSATAVVRCYRSTTAPGSDSGRRWV